MLSDTLKSRIILTSVPLPSNAADPEPSLSSRLQKKADDVQLPFEVSEQFVRTVYENAKPVASSAEASVLLGADGAGIFQRLVEDKKKGRIQKMGVAVHSTKEIDAVLEKFKFDFVKLPASIIDQRMFQSGQFARLHAMGIGVWGSSVFLNGFILMAPKLVPSYLGEFKRHMRHVRAAISHRGLSMMETAFGYAMSLHELDRLVVELRSDSELDELLRSLDKTELQAPPDRRDWKFAEEFAFNSDQLADPSLWEPF